MSVLDLHYSQNAVNVTITLLALKPETSFLKKKDCEGNKFLKGKAYKCSIATEMACNFVRGLGLHTESFLRAMQPLFWIIYGISYLPLCFGFQFGETSEHKFSVVIKRGSKQLLKRSRTTLKAMHVKLTFKNIWRGCGVWVHELALSIYTICHIHTVVLHSDQKEESASLAVPSAPEGSMAH